MNRELKSNGPVQNMNLPADDLAWGFNGSYVCMYATSNGRASKTWAHFDRFEYRAAKQDSTPR